MAASNVTSCTPRRRASVSRCTSVTWRWPTIVGASSSTSDTSSDRARGDGAMSHVPPQHNRREGTLRAAAHTPMVGWMLLLVRATPRIATLVRWHLL